MQNIKNYVGNGWTVPTQYGEMVNLSLNLDKLKNLPVDKFGNIKLTVGKLKESNQKSKATHWVAENNYKKETKFDDFVDLEKVFNF